MTDQGDQQKSQTPQSSPAMHLAGAGEALLVCRWCDGLFKPKRGWQAHCSPRCRNAFHGEQRRKEVIRKAAPELYDALLRLLTDPGATDQARTALAKAGYREQKPAP